MDLSRKKERELTHIDILDDSVVDIMDKIFYKATGGKTIDYAGDTPMPNAVNPLSNEQVLDWGDNAMKISFQRVSRTPIRYGKKVISKIARFSQRSTAEPFYCYKSDAPTAKAFKSDEPVGPAAKALKAAGVLSAVARHNGLVTDDYFRLFNAVWSPVTEDIETYVTPDITAASSKDLIKFIRSTDHVTYGFNHDAPAVTIDTGKYKPETMSQNYMFDWHSFALTLRYIGEFIHKYNVVPRSIDNIFYAAPAYAEGRKFEMYDMAFHAEVEPASMKSPILAELAASTLKYYTACVNDYGIANRLRAHASNISVSADSDATAAMLRRVEADSSKLKIHIPKNAAVYHDPVVYGEIESHGKPRFRDSIAKLVADNMRSYIPTWRSVHATVWSWAFRSKFEKREELLGYLRRISILPAYSSTLLAGFLAALSLTIPKGIGHMIKVMLTNMMPSIDEANAEFAAMLIDLSGKKTLDFNMSYDSMYVTAIRTTVSAQHMVGMIHLGLNRTAAYAHSANAFISEFPNTSDLPSSLVASFRSFMLRRLDYWSAHYRSRMMDYQALLHTLREIAKERGYKVTGVRSLGKTLALDHIVPLPIKDSEKLTYETFVQLVDEYKRKAVMYNFLATGYKHATVTIDSNFKVDVELKSGDLRRMMTKTSANFARKKEKWNSEEADAARLWRTKVDDLKKVDRNVDILRLCDTFLNPPHKWADMYHELLSRFKLTSRLVSNMIKKHVMGHKAVNVNPELDEAFDVREAIELTSGERVVVKAGYICADNRYAALAFDDSDSDQEEDDIVDTNATRIVPTVKPTTIVTTDTKPAKVNRLAEASKLSKSVVTASKPSSIEAIMKDAKMAFNQVNNDVVAQRLEMANTALANFRASNIPTFTAQTSTNSDDGLELGRTLTPIEEPAAVHFPTSRFTAAIASSNVVHDGATMQRIANFSNVFGGGMSSAFGNVATPVVVKTPYEQNLSRLKYTIQAADSVTYMEEAFQAYVEKYKEVLTAALVPARDFQKVIGEYHAVYVNLRLAPIAVPVQDDNQVDIV